MTIRNQSCPNENCKFFRLSQMGNVVVHSQKLKRFRCSECRKTWVQHRNELHYGLKSGARKMLVTKYLLFEQNMSIRGVAQMLQVSPSTVQRFKKRLASFDGQLEPEMAF